MNPGREFCGTLFRLLTRVSNWFIAYECPYVIPCGFNNAVYLYETTYTYFVFSGKSRATIEMYTYSLLEYCLIYIVVNLYLLWELVYRPLFSSLP